MIDLVSEIKNIGCKALQDELMSKHTSFKIGGPADLFIEIDEIHKLSKILNLLQAKGVPYFLLGNGSNLLVSDYGIEGCVLKLTGDFEQIKMLDEKIVEVGAGVLLSRLASFAADNLLTGLEFAAGIPGTVGGAAFMNAGAYGGQMSDVVIKSCHVTEKGNIEENNDLHFGYRESSYMKSNSIIGLVTIKLCRGDRDAIKSKMSEFTSRRKEKQPLSLPSAGSVFKRPKGNFAGTLIESCDLKGKRIGGAMVSDKHAGFIVNVGGATSKDVMELIEYIHGVVYNKTGVDLQQEIKFIGRR